MRLDRFIACFRGRKLLFGSITLLLVINGIALACIKEAETTTIPRLHREYEAGRKARFSGQEDSFHLRMNHSKEDVLRLVGSLPHKLMIAEVMQEVLELLAGNELPRVHMSFVPESTDFPGVMKYTTSFGVSGKYPGLKSFLADMQNSKTLFCIEGLAFTNQSTEEELVSLNLKIALYLKSGPLETPGQVM